MADDPIMAGDPRTSAGAQEKKYREAVVELYRKEAAAARPRFLSAAEQPAWMPGCPTHEGEADERPPCWADLAENEQHLTLGRELMHEMTALGGADERLAHMAGAALTGLQDMKAIPAARTPKLQAEEIGKRALNSMNETGYKMNARFVQLMESWMVIKDGMVTKDVLQNFMLRVGTRFFTHNATQLSNFKAGCGLLACYVEMRANKYREWWIGAGQCPIERKKDHELLNVQGGGDIHDWRFELRDVENPFNEPPGVHKQGSKPFRGRMRCAESLPRSEEGSDRAERGSEMTGTKPPDQEELSAHQIGRRIGESDRSANQPPPAPPAKLSDLGLSSNSWSQGLPYGKGKHRGKELPRYTQEEGNAFTDGKAGKGNDFLQRFRPVKAGKGNDRGEEPLRPRGKPGGKGTHPGKEHTDATSPWERKGSEKIGKGFKGKDRGWEEELRRSGRKSDGKGKDRTLRYYMKGHTHAPSHAISSTPGVVADARALFAGAVEASSLEKQRRGAEEQTENNRAGAGAPEPFGEIYSDIEGGAGNPCSKPEQKKIQPIHLLIEMGFNADLAHTALQKNADGDIESAIDYLVERQNQ